MRRAKRPSHRPATAADLESFFGKPLTRTVRAWVMELDGRIIAVGGLAYHRGRPWDLFSDVTPEAQKYPATMLKAARSVLAGIGQPAVAAADIKVPHSERVLLMLGFKPLGNGTFRWGPE